MTGSGQQHFGQPPASPSHLHGSQSRLQASHNYAHATASQGLGHSQPTADYGDYGASHESRMNAVAKERERMKALGTQKQMMESLLDQKFKDFKNTINRNLKERFDTELKRALFHLWKHYKNCNEKHMTPEDIEKSIYENLRKVHIETHELKEKNKALSEQVRIKEIETTDIINRQIKENSFGGQQKEVNQPTANLEQRKYYLEAHIANLNNDNANVERKLKEFQDTKQNRYYEMKLGLEMQGRETMDEYARKLAVEYCPNDSASLVNLRNEVANLAQEYELVRNQWIEAGHGQNPTDYKIRMLEHEQFDLEKKLESLKH
jgi:hypothetical protein